MKCINKTKHDLQDKYANTIRIKHANTIRIKQKLHGTLKKHTV